MLVTNALAFAVYLLVVLVGTFAFGWGFIGVCWSTSLNYFLRFVFAYLYITYKDSFKEANQANMFTLQTVEKLGY